MIKEQIFAISVLLPIVIASALPAKTRGLTLPENSPCLQDADCPGLQHCSDNVCQCGQPLKRHIEDPQRCVTETITLSFEMELDSKIFGAALNKLTKKKRQKALQTLIDDVQGRIAEVIDVKEPRFERRNAKNILSVTMTLINPEAITGDSQEESRHKRFDLGSALEGLGATGVTTGFADADLGGSCEDDSTCVLGDNLRCSGGQCICQTGYVQEDDPNPPHKKKCYEDVDLGDNCMVAKQCGNWMICDTICKCDSGSTNISSTACGPRAGYGEACVADPQCSGVEHAVCLSGSCGCDDGYEESTETAGTCVMIPVATLPPDRGFGQNCKTSPQCVLGSYMECDGSTCVCRSDAEEGNGDLAGTCVQPILVNAEWMYTAYAPPLSAAETAYLETGNTLLINIHLVYHAYESTIEASLHDIVSNEVVQTNVTVSGKVAYRYVDEGPSGGSRKRRATREEANNAFLRAAQEAGFEVQHVYTRIG